jgi:hypothetical protein
MKPAKGFLKQSFEQKNANNEKVVLKTGTEVLILAKLENFGATGTGYLMFESETKTFLRLSSGHLKVEHKENVKLILPKISLRETQREKDPTGNTVVSVESELIFPDEQTKLTLGKMDKKDIVVIGVITSNDYPSGAAYIICDILPNFDEKTTIVDSLDVNIVHQGNMILI